MSHGDIISASLPNATAAWIFGIFVSEAHFCEQPVGWLLKADNRAKDNTGGLDARIGARMDSLALKAASSGHRLRIFDLIKNNVRKFSK